MFNVGDIVRIKPDADKIRTNYLGFARLMLKYLDTEATIRSVDIKSYGPDRPVYKLEGVIDDINKDTNGDGYWMFASDWLELVPIEIEEVTSTEIDDILSN